MMTDFLISVYPWATAFHIMSVLSWMAGLFYLPRLFVHHVEQASENPEMANVFQMMEAKLLRLIMNPAMIATWVFGLMLVLTPGIADWSDIWPWTKAVSVLTMTWFHMWLGVRRRELVNGQCSVTGRRFRLMNEVPTVLMVVIVLSVVLKF
jgi:protoporphyrinogen IX oxidase